METPVNEKISNKDIAEKYSNKVFYQTVYSKGRKCGVKPCIIECSNNILFVRYFDKDFNKVGYLSCFSWNNLHETLEEAEKYANAINEKFDAFKYKPYVSYKTLTEHFDELKTIESLIDKLLYRFENYDGIDFCDVSAGGIQVRIFHKKIKGYCYGEQKTLKYDFSNKDEIPFEVVKEFIKIDTPELVNNFLDFIRDGEKYGWD